MIRVVIKHPGESGFEVQPPEVQGWTCTFVARVGGEHTTFTYRRDEDVVEDNQDEIDRRIAAEEVRIANDPDIV